MDHRRLRPAIMHRNPDQHILRRRLGVLHEHIKITVVIKNACIRQFKFRRILPPFPVFRHQPGIGKFPLRILVEIFEIRMGRRGIKVVIDLLHVFAVVALRIVQAEESFL